MAQTANDNQNTIMEQSTTRKQTKEPDLFWKSDILYDLVGVMRYNDTKLTRREFSDSSCSRPEQFYLAVHEWMQDPLHDVLCLRTPSEEKFPTHLINIVCKMADTLREARQPAAIITFGGGPRGEYGVSTTRHPKTETPSPLDKMRSFVCTVITQLVHALPDIFEDPNGELSGETLDAVREKKDEDPFFKFPFKFPIEIDEAVRLIQALVNVLSLQMRLFFVFEGCDKLTLLDNDLTDQLAELLCFLAAPHSEGQARKLLWVGPADSMPIKKVKLTVGHGAFRIVDHPRDWNW